MTNKCWSFDEESYSYDTLGDLIEANADEIKVGSIVYVADKIKPDVRRYVDAHAVIEGMQERYYDDCGIDDEPATWPDVSMHDMSELEKMIAEFVERVSPPSFWIVRDVKEYVVTAEDLS